MTAIGAAWRLVRDRFRTADLESPELDARLLAEAAFGLDALALLQREREEAPVAAVTRLDSYGDRRLAGEPVARILGHKEFYGLDFALNDATLVPRPETEMLVDLALEAFRGVEAPLLLDLGTGSGCVAIAVPVHAPTATAVAVDVSDAALLAARENAVRHGVAGRLSLRLGSWCAPLEAAETFDVVVANPPYVESDIIEELQPEVRDFEPRLALDGGEDGLACHRAVAAQGSRRLRPHGTLLLEIGSDQGFEAGAILAAVGLSRVDIRKDIAGLDRVVIGHHL